MTTDYKEGEEEVDEESKVDSRTEKYHCEPLDRHLHMSHNAKG